MGEVGVLGVLGVLGTVGGVGVGLRLPAPGPLANSIGITPNTNAKAVIMMGRKRICPASCAAWIIGTPF